MFVHFYFSNQTFHLRVACSSPAARTISRFLFSQPKIRARSFDRMKSIAIKDLHSWGHANGHYETTREDPTGKPVIFPSNAQFNEMLYVWEGPIEQLVVDAIVNSTSEGFYDSDRVSQKIMEAAGDELIVEVRSIDELHIGEAVITRGCQLPAKKIIHTIGPKYSKRYQNASENALHCCYRNSLRIAKEQGLRSIAFCCIYTHQRKYPREPATHVALRTIRRFVEHFPKAFDQIILCVENDKDHCMYTQLTPLYFPRSKNEEMSSMEKLPQDLGNTFGEPIIEDRKIRILPFPSTSSDSKRGPEDSPSCDYFDVVHDSFSKMTTDPDQERLMKIHGSMHGSEQGDAAYCHYLTQANNEDYPDIQRLNLIYDAGMDQNGHPVIIYIGKNLPVYDVNLERVMLYIIKTMDGIADGPYTFVYIHTGVTGDNQPDLFWLQNLFETLSSKYHQNLKAFHVLRPTMWLKMVFWMIKTLVNSNFYNKINYIYNAKKISEIAKSLKLPRDIYQPEPNAETEEAGLWM